ELLHGQAALLGVSSVVESQAQRYAAQLIARQGLEADAGGEAETAATERFQEVDLGTLDLVRPRCVGVEHAALTVLRQLGFEDNTAPAPDGGSVCQRRPNAPAAGQPAKQPSLV